jgi:hypothetical protein
LINVTGFFARVLVVVALAAEWSCGTRAPADSVYTSIRPADCMAPLEETAAPYAARDLGVQQCPAPNGLRLLVVASDANTWIDLAGPGVTWSGERPIVYESPIGNFPSVDASQSVEWRRDGRDQPTALIFRVTAQDRDTLQTNRSILYVVRLQPDRTCVIGRAATNEEARTLADSSNPCLTP